MSSRFRLILALYFSTMITDSHKNLVFIWNPGTGFTIKTEKRVINGPGRDKMLLSGEICKCIIIELSVCC